MPRGVGAQPPDGPSNMQVPMPWKTPVRPKMPPDPALITPEELQKLTGGPTVVTWSGRDVPAQDAIKALLAVTDMVPSPLGEAGRLKPVNVSWKATPFWKAARDVEVQAGGWWGTGANGAISFSPLSQLPFGSRVSMPGLRGRLAAQTPFVTIWGNSLSRTAVTQVQLGAEQDLAPATPDQTELAMSAYFDPKLRARSIEVRQLKFQPRKDGPVINANRAAYSFSTGIRGSLIATHALPLPAEIGAKTQIFRVSGVLHSVITSASHTWKVPDLLAAPNATHTIGASSYAVESAEVQANQLILRLKAVVPNEPRVPVVPLLAQPFSNVRVRDSQGRELTTTSSRALRTGATAQQEMRFRLTGVPNEAITAPYSLEWGISTELRSLDVPFELSDVPVP